MNDQFVVEKVEPVNISDGKYCPLFSSANAMETCIGEKCAFFTGFDEAEIARDEEGKPVIKRVEVDGADKPEEKRLLLVRRVQGCSMAITPLMTGNANTSLNQVARATEYQAEMMMRMVMPRSSSAGQGILTPYGITPASR